MATQGAPTLQLEQPASRQQAWGLVKGNPILATMAALFVVLLFVVVGVSVRLSECEKGRIKSGGMSNLLTGGNNPNWQLQMGDAGWGGPMHTTYQPGQPRVWGASADGPDRIAVKPTPAHGCPPAPSPAAAGETQALVAAQALDPSTAKHMGDDALVRVMNGGSAY